MMWSLTSEVTMFRHLKNFLRPATFVLVSILFLGSVYYVLYDEAQAMYGGHGNSLNVIASEIENPITSLKPNHASVVTKANTVVDDHTTRHVTPKPKWMRHYEELEEKNTLLQDRINDLVIENWRLKDEKAELEGDRNGWKQCYDNCLKGNCGNCFFVHEDPDREREENAWLQHQRDHNSDTPY